MDKIRACRVEEASNGYTDEGIGRISNLNIFK